MDTLPTITSPTLSEVIVFYAGPNLCSLEIHLRHASSPYRRMAPGRSAALRHYQLFEVFHEMYAGQDFRLTLRMVI
jgi:hypothetical protein